MALVKSSLHSETFIHLMMLTTSSRSLHPSYTIPFYDADDLIQKSSSILYHLMTLMPSSTDFSAPSWSEMPLITSLPCDVTSGHYLIAIIAWCDVCPCAVTSGDQSLANRMAELSHSSITGYDNRWPESRCHEPLLITKELKFGTNPRSEIW